MLAKIVKINSTRFKISALVSSFGIILIAMTRWGGTATPGPLFWFGVAVLGGSLLFFGVLCWWIFLSPLADGVGRSGFRSNLEIRQLIAVLVAVSGLLFITGGLWDEIWHRLYGIDEAINDFFWRPHLMIYGSMGLNALLVLTGLFLALRGRGSLRQGLRSEPLIALIGLTSAYMMLSAPSDLVWHQIYGLDITAWSLPHLMVGVTLFLVMISAVALQLSLLPSAPWQGLRGITAQELLIILQLAVAVVVIMQIGITEWEELRVSLGELHIHEGDPFSQAFFSRPQWLYPVALLAISLLFSNLALHLLRRPGVATLVMLVVIGFRFLALSIFALSASPIDLPLLSQFLVLIPALVIDAWAAWRVCSRSRGKYLPESLMTGSFLALLVFMAVALPVISEALIYPEITVRTVPGILLWGTVLGLWASWAGALIGSFVSGVERQVIAREQAGYKAAWVGIGLFVALAVFATYFILTAAPPQG